ncbi:MAG: glycosyltransferase family 4 protein [Spirochaetales bacterium]
MKLLVVSSSLPRGSGEAFLIPEILELKLRGHNVCLVPINPKGGHVHTEGALLEGVSIIRPVLDFGIAGEAFIAFLMHPMRCISVLGTIFRESRNTTILFKNLAIVPKGLWLSRIVQKRGVEHIHAYWAAVASTMAMVAAAVADISWSLTAYRWDIAENNLLAEKSRRASFLRVADRNGVAEMRNYADPKGSKVYLIHSGAAVTSNADIQESSVPMPQNIPERHGLGDPFTIVLPAMFVEKKGHRYLVQALAILASRDISYRCIFVGDGPLRDDTEKKLEKLNIKRFCVFTGAISHKALLALMLPSSCDLVVLPSIETDDGEKEGIPMSLIEAMAQGTCVISTSTGGIPELLENGAGILVPQKDPEALAGAIERAYKEPDLRRRYAEVGKRKIEQGYAAPAVVEELLGLVSQSIKG